MWYHVITQSDHYLEEKVDELEREASTQGIQDITHNLRKAAIDVPGLRDNFSEAAACEA